LNRALFLARRACRKVDYPASLTLAAIFGTGRIEDSEREFFGAMDRGARQGHRDAQYGLGRWYEDGTGVARDLKQALHWYTTASLNGSEEADSAIARLYASGLDGESN
jgi:uncharacterized protein